MSLNCIFYNEEGRVCWVVAPGGMRRPGSRYSAFAKEASTYLALNAS
jgi:hypothetical protein